jgi:hypothetical protein
MRASACLAVAWSLVLAASTFASAAHAQGVGPSERAERLYAEGKQLATAGKFAEACPRFEESQKLEPAIGTQFNLADCYAHTARPATALALFLEVAKIAQMSGKQERQKAAEERAAALAPTVPRIRVVLSEKAAAANARHPGDVIVRRDGALLPAEELGRPIAIDPGVHVIAASSSGHIPWEKRVLVTAEGTFDVEVPPLAEVPPPPQKPRPSPFTYLGLGIGGLGIATVGVGAVFGLFAMNGKNEAGCDGVDCQRGNPQTLRDAQTSATLSTVFVISGAVLIAGGTTLWLLAPKKSTALTANASIAPGSASFTLGKAF